MVMSDQEKEELYNNNKGIVYQVANRYRYFDTEYDDILGWGFVGFVVALNEYEEIIKNRKQLEDDVKDESILSFAMIAFDKVRIEIINAYRKEPSKASVVSMQEVFGADLTLEDRLADEKRLNFSEKDILTLLHKALAKETTINRKITIDYFLTEKTAEDISAEVNKPIAYTTRTTRRGQALIKKYLRDNGILDEDDDNDLDNKRESNPKKKVKKAELYRDVAEKDYRKLKYIRVQYPLLTINEISSLLKVTSSSLANLFRYTTVAYRKSGLDDSVEEQVLMFMKYSYPERLPGEVLVTKGIAHG